jgi:hypothetical protein
MRNGRGRYKTCLQTSELRSLKNRTNGTTVGCDANPAVIGLVSGG